ncbi:MAG: 16S rRNA (guanine(527)-N(7))-methyltransferase RsmG [Capsulimonadaceae bacterium]|nr:16S rRNA (guanine(527)-N(7))-methyltransferase RsmG [Capsulimonadaceae bacterium]
MPSDTISILETALAEWDIVLTDRQKEQFSDYADLLIEWNASRMNLTRLTAPQDIAIGHFLDSLAVIRAAVIRPDVRLIDVGTGAGFPGLPIKILRPDLRLTLLEGTAKKLLFCQTVVNRCRMTDIELIHGRAEETGTKAGFRSAYDIVTARAVAPMSRLMPWAAPFLSRGGTFVAWKGPGAAEEMEQARDVAGRLRLRWRIVPVALPLSGEPPRVHQYILCQRED